MKQKTLVFISILICTIAGIVFVFFIIPRNQDETLDISEASDNRYDSYIATVNWQHRFYDKTPVSRDSFSIRRIIAQIGDGDFIAEVCWGNMWHPPGIDLPGARQQYQTPNNIMIVNRDLSDGRSFFEGNPEWLDFYFVTSCLRGYIYILAHSHGEEGQECFATLYTYNHDGIMIAQHIWGSSIAPTINDAFVIEDTLIINKLESLIFTTKQGEVLFETARPTSITIGNGYLYVIYEAGSRVLKKIEVPSGQIVWGHELDRYYNNEIIIGNPAMAYCEATQQLYLYQHNALFVFEENVGRLHRVKDLTHSDSYFKLIRGPLVEGEFFEGATIFAADGLLHLVWRSINRVQGYIISDEWVFARLINEAAQERMAEIAAAQADIPVIRVFCYSLRNFNMLELFAYDRGARVEFAFLPVDTPNPWQDYIESLNAAIFAGTARYDIVNMVPIYYLQSYVDRGLLIDFTNYVGDRFFDNEIYFTNLYETIMIDGGLYYLPGMIDVPVLLVPLDFPDIDRLRYLSQNWTWADFLEIAHEIANETGVPPITEQNAVFWSDVSPEMWFPFLSNTPQFYLFAEDVLRDLGTSGNRETFTNILEIYYALAQSELNQPQGEVGVFTFGTFASLMYMSMIGFSRVDFRDSYAVLPIPSMHGEQHFTFRSAAQAVLVTGESTDIAIEFLLYEFGNNPLIFDNPFTTIRPSAEAVERYVITDMFGEYTKIVENLNAVLYLPPSVTSPISETVESLLHGALTLDAAVDRIADIMWLYMNE